MQFKFRRTKRLVDPIIPKARCVSRPCWVPRGGRARVERIVQASSGPVHLGRAHRTERALGVSNYRACPPIWPDCPVVPPCMLAPPLMPLGCMLVPPRARVDVLAPAPPRPVVSFPRTDALWALLRGRTADVERAFDPVLTVVPRVPRLNVRSPTSGRAALMALRERTPSR